MPNDRPLSDVDEPPRHGFGVAAHARVQSTAEQYDIHVWLLLAGAFHRSLVAPAQIFIDLRGALEIVQLLEAGECSEFVHFLRHVDALK